jgi:hypothetical protein
VGSQAALALKEISQSNITNQHAIVNLGGVTSLAALIKTSPHAEARALSALTPSLTPRYRPRMPRAPHDPAARAAAFACAGYLVTTVHLMPTLSPHNLLFTLPWCYTQVRAEAAGALWALSEDGEIKVQIAQASTIQPLVTLLGSGDERAYSHANNALASLGFANSCARARTHCQALAVTHAPSCTHRHAPRLPHWLHRHARSLSGRLVRVTPTWHAHAHRLLDPPSSCAAPTSARSLRCSSTS